MSSGEESRESIENKAKQVARFALEQKLASDFSSAVVGIAAKVSKEHSADQLRAILNGLFGIKEWDIAVSELSSFADARPHSEATLDQGLAWEVCARLEKEGFGDAEPIYLTASPSPDSPGVARHLKVWGAPYPNADEEEMDEVSRGDSAWAIKQLNLAKAWELCKENGVLPGEGVVVGHPDTGYTDHPLVKDKLSLALARSFIQNEGDARDRFADGIGRNPGHGTGTGSVIVGPNDGSSDVHGVAPAAKLIPLRVANSVIHFDFGAVSQAIEYAALHDMDVVSMSLGGPRSSKQLEAAVRRALDKGVIIVSAAGNNLPTVVFPAALPGVVAMAASNPLGRPWRFSGYGDEVVATAPGELIWNARATVDERTKGEVLFNTDRGRGTSFATSHVAGIAALWLSYHGKKNIVAQLGGDVSLLPFAFQKLLRDTANTQPKFLESQAFGSGIVDAAALLLYPLKNIDPQEIAEYRDKVLGRKKSWFGGLLQQVGMFFRVPTRNDFAQSDVVSLTPTKEEDVKGLVAKLLQVPVGGLEEIAPLVDELVAVATSKDVLRLRLIFASRQTEAGLDSALAGLRRELLKESLSTGLRARLTPAAKANVPRESAGSACSCSEALGQTSCNDLAVPKPSVRKLRVYTFDPSLSTQMETRSIQQTVLEVPWEDLKPGPVGEYVEVVDVDPASNSVYCPVDLDNPHLLAQDGHEPSMGNPQFHQQMVYAISMKTIKAFETALGRPLFWSPVRPWKADDKDKAELSYWNSGRVNRRDQYIQRLRIHPHALRDQNAYYSPAKRALLFGYFNATENSPGEVYPGGIVFTCLSHDIIAHETTHAIVDGMHTEFNQPTNPDVFAFHEAISDIVALLLHFSYPAVVRDQIAKTRGDLDTQNLLLQLAQEFGRATGGHHALRDAIGGLVEVSEGDPGKVATSGKVQVEVFKPGPGGLYKTVETKRVFQRYQPDPSLIENMDYASEAHRRGSLLVAAVFDAYLAIYKYRSADLVRIATGGSGVLPEGHLQADLIDRMAKEARTAAEHVLRMCIRGLDYTPPLDITFGEFLRAVITADKDLVPSDPLGYRVAFIESFRKWGIYPRDVRVLAEESLTWHPVCGTPLLNETVFQKMKEEEEKSDRDDLDTEDPLKMFENLRLALDRWKPGANREKVFDEMLECQSFLGRYLQFVMKNEKLGDQYLPELRKQLLNAFTVNKEDHKSLGYPKLGVSKLRPARRIGPNSEHKTEMVFEVTAVGYVAKSKDQPPEIKALRNDETAKKNSNSMQFVGGITFLVDMDTWCVRYAIFKRIASKSRLGRYVAYKKQLDSQSFGAAEYRCGGYEGDVKQDRAVHIEAMRADSCLCRKRGLSKEEMMREPFAVLHRNPPETDEIMTIKQEDSNEQVNAK